MLYGAETQGTWLWSMEEIFSVSGDLSACLRFITWVTQDLFTQDQGFQNIFQSLLPELTTVASSWPPLSGLPFALFAVLKVPLMWTSPFACCVVW